MTLKLVEKKQLRDFRRGRINLRKEIRRQSRLRNNLEKKVYRQLLSIFSRFVNTKAYLIREFNQYDADIAARDLREEIEPVMYMHYRQVFRAIYDNNEAIYETEKKAVEAVVFGRNIDIEDLINLYNRDRLLYLSGISISVARKVAQIIEEGREEGLSLNQLARRITEKVLPISRSRAALIARTETHNAASFANHNYHDTLRKDLGVNMMKRWVSTADERTRSAHVEANGQIRNMDEDFDIGGSAMNHAGDPKGGAKNVVNCRCVIVYADERDIVL
jgi:uncharacterized protein with gpF-like domain